MATARDYYEILSVTRNADEEEIRRAFRRLARQYHPDVCNDPDANERFKEVNEAYQVLCDPEKRQSYDRYGHRGVSETSGQGGFTGTIFDDIFESFFNMSAGSSSRERIQRGADLQVTVRITLEEAAFGCEKEVEIRRLEACHLCSGAGAEPGTKPERCPDCNGSGEMRRLQQSFFGRFVSVTECPRCRGQGQVILVPCKNCRGSGMERVDRRIGIIIPPGIEDQMQIQKPGEGDAGLRGGPKGNLYVLVTVQPHKVFRRQGNDLLYPLTINFAQAALGDEVEIPTIDGEPVKVKIQAGIQNGRTLRVKNKGMQYLRSNNRGDLQVMVNISTPTNLTEEQRDLLRRLSQTFRDNGKQDESKSIFDRVFGRE
jgi:molecular chaperone DnaJ